MALTNNSTSVDFYREAINALLIQMGGETDEHKIDQLHGNVLRLSSRMADTAFADIRNRTSYLASLVADLNRIAAAAKAGGGAKSLIDKLAEIANTAAPIVAGATGKAPPTQ